MKNLNSRLSKGIKLAVSTAVLLGALTAGTQPAHASGENDPDPWQQEELVF